jgi:transposase
LSSKNIENFDKIDFFVEIFDNFFIFFSDNEAMMVKGLTIQEIADKLGIPYKTAHKRLETAGIKPLTKEAIYPESALEAIRSVPGKGRPKKAPEPASKAKK